MGNWTITIKGLGQHHNNGSPHDADMIAKQLVRELTNARQTLESAEFVSDSTPAEDISAGAARNTMTTDTLGYGR